MKDAKDPTEILNVNIVSVDWCDETLRENLPGDEEQFVEVRRFTGAENRKRQSIAARFKVKGNSIEDMELEMALDQLKSYEWSKAIIGFKFKDNRGRYLVFDDKNPAKNARIYDHIKGHVASFIDDLILRVNKEEDSLTPSEEVDELEKNS